MIQGRTSTLAIPILAAASFLADSEPCQAQSGTDWRQTPSQQSSENYNAITGEWWEPGDMNAQVVAPDHTAPFMPPGTAPTNSNNPFHNLTLPRESFVSESLDSPHELTSGQTHQVTLSRAVSSVNDLAQYFHQYFSKCNPYLAYGIGVLSTLSGLSFLRSFGQRTERYFRQQGLEGRRGFLYEEIDS